MENLSNFINESKLSENNINRVKKFLIDYYKVNTWEECVDKQKYGDCKKICTLIKRQFPLLFNKYALDIHFDFSEIAKKLINDDGDMYGNHFVLTKGQIMYDFARGANCINGIYVLTQKEDNSDKYDVILTDKEKELIIVSVNNIL